MNLEELFGFLQDGLAIEVNLDEEEEEIQEFKINELCRLLELNLNLNSIKIKYADISKSAYISLFASLARLPKLDKLEIIECDLEYLAYISLNNFNNRISSIDFTSSNLTNTGSSLAELIHSSTNLRELYLSGCGINNNDIIQIAQALSVNQSLELLWLENNRITAEGAVYLFNSLKNNRTLKKLNICANFLGDEGIKALVNILPYNNQLKLLYLDDNQITLEGLSLLIFGLSVNKNLETFGFGYNKLQASQLQEAMAHLILGKNNIKRLSFSGYPIDAGLGNIIANMLEKNYILTELEINKKNLTVEAKKGINLLLERNEIILRKKVNNAISILNVARLCLHVAISDKYNSFLANLPFELITHILRLIDDENLLTPEQKNDSIKYGQNKATLGYNKNNFLNIINYGYHTFFRNDNLTVCAKEDSNELMDMHKQKFKD